MLLRIDSRLLARCLRSYANRCTCRSGSHPRSFKHRIAHEMRYACTCRSGSHPRSFKHRSESSYAQSMHLGADPIRDHLNIASRMRCAPIMRTSHPMLLQERIPSAIISNTASRMRCAPAPNSCTGAGADVVCERFQPEKDKRLVRSECILIVGIIKPCPLFRLLAEMAYTVLTSVFSQCKIRCLYSRTARHYPGPGSSVALSPCVTGVRRAGMTIGLWVMSCLIVCPIVF